MNTRRYRAGFPCLFVWIGLSVTAVAADDDMTLADVYVKSRSASVEILVDGHHSGSGAFISANGKVVTAAHVIGRPNRKVEVLTYNGDRLTACLCAVDLGHDLALMQAESPDGRHPHLALADQLPPAGAKALLCSAAAFRRGVMQPGMMARDGLTFEYQEHFVEVTHVAALIQEGTSGGPWVDDRGQLIGIQSGSVTVKGVPAGIANVAPVQAIRSLLQTERNANSATIGVFVDEIWLLSADALRRYPSGTEGMVIQAVSQNGPAERAGLRKGDVIAACEGRKLRFRDEFLFALRKKRPGESIELTVVRADGAGESSVSVGVGRLEVGWPDERP